MARLSLAEVGLLLLLVLALVSNYPEAHNFHLDTVGHAAGDEGVCSYRWGILFYKRTKWI